MGSSRFLLMIQHFHGRKLIPGEAHTHTHTLWVEENSPKLTQDQRWFGSHSNQLGCCRCSFVVSDSLQPHGLQHARPPYPSLTSRVCSNSCPLSRWCHPAISSSVTPFSFCLQSFSASGSFPMSQFFPLCSQSIGASASASVLPITIQGWDTLGFTGLVSLQSKGLTEGTLGKV